MPPMPIVSSAHSTRSMTAAGSSPRLRGPKAISSKTVGLVPDSCVFGFWNRIPQRCASSCWGSSTVGVPSSRTRPARRPAIETGASPEATRHNVLLPDSLAPDDADDLARIDGQVDVLEHVPTRADVLVGDALEADRHVRAG